ncbi:MAG: hypothetical protein CM1200mP2_20740 [Planctomycetaceae bacterium]|nr:MAG: hypothetical protein CM1200mP2_20740 [Planctomycetaceae bacterium]
MCTRATRRARITQRRLPARSHTGQRRGGLWALGRTLDKYGYRGNVTLETEYKNYREEAQVDPKTRLPWLISKASVGSSEA